MRYAETAGAVTAAPEGWTEDRVGALRKLWGDGLSASQIAMRLGGVSRNAVIGKVHREGLPGRVTTSRSRGPKRACIARSFVRPERRPPHPPKPFTPREIEAPPALHTDLLDLRAAQCRWPIGDPREDGFAFCGRQTTGISYCEHHARIAFQPAARRRR